MKVNAEREVMNPHSGDSRCVCTDGRAGERDTAETCNSVFGPVISSYSRAQAIEDGVLVDVSETGREAGFTVPVALTRAVWEDCVTWGDEDSHRKGGCPQDERGRLWDVVWMARFAARLRPGRERLLYSLIRVPRQGRGHVARKVTLKLLIGPGDAGEPVITILQPEED